MEGLGNGCSARRHPIEVGRCRRRPCLQAPGLLCLGQVHIHQLVIRKELHCRDGVGRMSGDALHVELLQGLHKHGQLAVLPLGVVRDSHEATSEWSHGPRDQVPLRLVQVLRSPRKKDVPEVPRPWPRDDLHEHVGVVGLPNIQHILKTRQLGPLHPPQGHIYQQTGLDQLKPCLALVQTTLEQSDLLHPSSPLRLALALRIKAITGADGDQRHPSCACPSPGGPTHALPSAPTPPLAKARLLESLGRSRGCQRHPQQRTAGPGVESMHGLSCDPDAGRALLPPPGRSQGLGARGGREARWKKID
mmetsp:Transcript_23059/g.67127  ORF Transcript_23059/g.67127 Transcript_23059/m.67127 type:complete len:305 (-) Transcript_23059:18-932(-)